MAGEQELLVNNRDRVLYLTLNRPDKLNALSDGIKNMIRESDEFKARGNVNGRQLVGAGGPQFDEQGVPESDIPF